LSSEKLDAFSASGVLKPSWRHFIVAERRYVKGTSLCEEPMLWHPDDELAREPCLIIEQAKIACPVHFIKSSEAYHLTKDLALAKRKKQDIEPIIEAGLRKFSKDTSIPDEAFVEGSILLDWVVAVGFQEDFETGDQAAKEIALRFSSSHDLPVINMSRWQISEPHVREIDDLVDEAIAEHAGRLRLLR
jgi:hypothetical protein